MRKSLLILPLLSTPVIAGCTSGATGVAPYPAGGSEMARLHLAPHGRNLVSPEAGTEPREACAMGLRDPEVCQREDETRLRVEKAALRAKASPVLAFLGTPQARAGSFIPAPEWTVDEDKLARDRAEARVRAAAWRAHGGAAGAEARPSLYAPPIGSPLYWPGGYAFARGRTMGRR